MSEIGYYRYKLTPSAQGITTVKLYINGSLASTATVITKEFCAGFKILKYLDASGRYRFFPFNDKWQQKDNTRQIGSVNNFITSILTSQTDGKNIGYRNERILSLVAGHVCDDELDKLADIFTSPRVYLYVGDGTYDRARDWVIVTLSGDGISRRRKDKFGKVSVEVKLPEHYSINQN